MKKEQKKQNVIPVRYKIIWGITKVITAPYFRWGLNYTHSKPVKLPEPCIILANHNTDFDPFIMSHCFKNQTYFIASENCFRRGTFSKILTWCYGLIPKIKGASDAVAVMKAIRSLKEGKNVCIFPEGGRSFNGITNPIAVATGKLVKVSGANMATIKIQGGYLKIPRWGFGRRKGPWNGTLVNIYTPEQLKAMTPEEITKHISDDLYENAYETQAKKPVKYKGKNLAVGMECAITVCPECKSVGHIKTSGNQVKCECCNTTATIDEYAYFNKEFKFHTVTEWDLWQEEYYKTYVASFSDNTKPIFTDENVGMRTINAEHETTILGEGTFALYKEYFSFTPKDKEEIKLFIKDVPDASVFSRSNFNFTDTSGIHYEVYADRLINVRKYFSCWNILRNN